LRFPVPSVGTYSFTSVLTRSFPWHSNTPA